MADLEVDQPADAALVQAVADGSESALGMLYDRYVDSVHAVALRLTGDRQVAEEVVQETFLALWNRAELFDPSLASLATWLRAIARNRAVDRIRAAGRRPPLVSLGDRDDPNAPATDLDRFGSEAQVIGGATPELLPEAAAEAGAVRSAVHAALTTMPEVERRVILLAYRDGLTQSEIAERLEWPLGTVKTRTRRALAHLRVAIERDDGSPIESRTAGPGAGR
jgi:RNA polymerase sigma-70 factor (ECF subfamily)